MTTDRDAFFQRVRQALAAGNRAGNAAVLEPRGRAGYQGGGPDLVARFCEELAVAGGQAHVVTNTEAAAATVLQLVQVRAARRVLLGRGGVVDALELPDRLRGAGVEVVSVDALAPGNSRDAFFAADVGVSSVDSLIAETGTVALRARPHEPRSLSLLPPVHIAVADRTQLLPDLFDLFEPRRGQDVPSLPSCLSLITGPSKTGDIELRLVTGVHGPGEVHVLLIASS
jgi:L-lactate utilization protein LutC